MAKRETPPPPIVKLFAGRIIPVSGLDHEDVAAFPEGTEFDLIARTKRSHPQLKTYWKALSVAVNATGRWGSREALHTAIKVKLGYVEPIFDLQGKVVGMKPDSVALDKMTHRDFCAYMDRAMAELAEAVGFDPLAFLGEDAA